MKFLPSLLAALSPLVLLTAVVAAEEEESYVKVLTKDNYQDALKENSVMLVEFYAPWCGHCKALAPEYEKAALELKDTELVLAKVDCTVENEVCQENGVQGYPTLKLFRDGTPSSYDKARKADAIVQYMKKQLLPVVSNLDQATFDKFVGDAKVAVIGFFDDEESEEAQTFKKVASKLRDDFVFGFVSDKSLAAKSGVAQPSVVLFKKFDEKKNVFPENVDASFKLQNGGDEPTITVDALTNFVTVNSVPLVNDVGPENYSKYVESGLPLAYLFVAKDEHREKFGSALETAAKKYRGRVNFVYIDAEQFGGHARNLNLKEEWPAFAIQEIGSGTKFPLDQSSELTVGSLTSFVEDFVAGKVKPSIKSAPIPENNDGPVKVVVADSFQDIVFDKEKDVLMEFYAPWCGHCKQLVPIYEKLGMQLSSTDKIVIAKMDATENDLPPGVGFTIEGFPTIKLFKAGSNEIVDFNGDRSVDGFLAFLKANALHKDFTVGESAEGGNKSSDDGAHHGHHHDHDDHDHDEL